MAMLYTLNNAGYISTGEGVVHASALPLHGEYAFQAHGLEVV